MKLVFTFLSIIILISKIKSATVENEDADNDNLLDSDSPNQFEDRQVKAATEKNQVQEWFEKVGKDAETSMKDFQSWFKDTVSNAQQNSNVPEAYLGNFQVIKMPFPQMGDVLKGMGNVAQAFEGLNKLIPKA